MAARGGLGVSTLALNLGIKIQEITNKSVIVAEYRPGQGTLGFELGLNRLDELNRLLQLKPAEITASEVENSLRPHSSGLRLLLASHQPRDCQNIQNVSAFEAITKQLPLCAKYVVIDLGPSLTPVAEKVIRECDDLIILVEPIPHTVAHSKELIEDLVSKGISEGRINIVLVNRIRSGMQLPWSQVEEKLGRSISVVFTPAPELAYQSATNNMPMVKQQPESLTAQQFSKLAERVMQRSR
jgi:pilus assembly protein CpaE